MYKRIKNLRKENRYSKEFIANYLNIKVSTYSKLESGKKKIKTSELILLAKLYNTSIDYIVEETDYRTRF